MRESKIPLEVRNVAGRPKGTEIRIVKGNYIVNFVSSVRNKVLKNGTIRTKPYKVTGKVIGSIEKLEGVWTFMNNRYYANLLLKIDDDYAITDKEFGGSVICYHEMMTYYAPSLISIFGKVDAMFLIVCAILKVLYPGVKTNVLERKYQISYLSNLIPNVALSPDTISEKLEKLGSTNIKFVEFMKSLMSKSPNCIIDGKLIASQTLTDSRVRIGRSDKGLYHTQYNLLYVYDYVEQMPKFFHPFSGNTNDITAFVEVYQKLDLKEGIVIGDRMFGSSLEMRDELTKRDITYLFPLKDDDLYYQMMVKALETGKCEEVSLSGSTYRVFRLYAGKKRHLTFFQDIEHEAQIKSRYLANIEKKEKGYTEEGYLREKQFFGAFVFESNRKYQPLKIAHLYTFRWSIENLNDEYVNDLELDNSNVQGIYRNNTQFFINHLALSLYYIIRNKKESVEKFQKISVRNLIDEMMTSRVLLEGEKIRVQNLPKKTKLNYIKAKFNLNVV
jgi:hypothetical protein